MGSATSPAGNPLDRRSVKRMLVLFAILGIIGVLLLAVSVALGLIVLVAAEAVFLMALRTFSKRARGS